MNKQEVKKHLQEQKAYLKSLEHPHKVWNDDSYNHYQNVSKGILMAEDRLYELESYPDAD
ncbi:MAG: hypothetical protein OXG15_12635 [Gammaproteobacteria bacterium]|nr:hypothetical protein [Gammaproteobacteria bacterium]